jgi:hypothetical protein
MQILGFLFFVAALTLASAVIVSMLSGSKAQIVAALRGDAFPEEYGVNFLYFQRETAKVLPFGKSVMPPSSAPLRLAA